MTDGLLSRQDVFDAIDDVDLECCMKYDHREWYPTLRKKIEALKSEPARKKGRWEIYVISPFDEVDCRCSLCGQDSCSPGWRFCPGCGAEMEEA